MSYLQKLIGKEIKDVYSGNGEYYTLGTGEKQSVAEIILYLEEYSLTIANNFALVPKHSNINELKGSYIQEILENKENIQIITRDKKSIKIDLCDEAFNGPEALVLNGPNNLIVVWN